jgi:hypothetical protein
MKSILATYGVRLKIVIMPQPVIVAENDEALIITNGGADSRKFSP